LYGYEHALAIREEGKLWVCKKRVLGTIFEKAGIATGYWLDG
jgi:hypothetical protein